MKSVMRSIIIKSIGLNLFIMFFLLINHSNGSHILLKPSIPVDSIKNCDTLFLKSGGYILVQYHEVIDNQVKFVKCNQEYESYFLITESEVLHVGKTTESPISSRRNNKLTKEIDPEIRLKNNIGIHLLGDGALLSIGYERQLISTPEYFIAGKFGIGINQEFQICFGPCSTSPDLYLIIPHHLTGNLGSKRSFFEIGIGGAFITGNGNHQYTLFLIGGYRLQPFKSSYGFFRIFGSYPISGDNINDIFLSPIGFSWGKLF